MSQREEKLDKIVSLCKRRGFVFPNSEIYGGIRGFYDYGPLGVELVNNIKQAWWREMVWSRDNVVGIDGSIITHPRVWHASGHIDSFTDPLVDCKECKKRFRADHLVKRLEQKETGAADEEIIKKLSKAIKGKRCPECGGELGEVKRFNLLVEARLGAVEGAKDKVFLRGEACQTIYLNYDNVLRSMRMKIPFGIAQIGKAFRNEITPRYFLYRQREFEQWDLQFFVNPKEMEKWYQYWKEERMRWYQNLVNEPKKLRFREHEKNELAHYAKVAFDIEYQTPFAGWQEWEGIHWRGDWDLSRHGQFSKKDFSYLNPETGERFIPWIVETSGGVDRTFLFLLLDAYCEEEVKKGDTRVVLKLKPELAPYKIAVFPLLANKEDLVKKAEEIYQRLRLKFRTAKDMIGNIGKRYRRQDEIGTPWCITVDFQTLNDDTVTVRDRDSMKQERVPKEKLIVYFEQKLKTNSA